MNDCPDDLLARVLSGNATSEQNSLLAAHLEVCADCRTAVTVGRDFDTVLGAQSGDDQIAARIAAQITRKRRRAFRPGMLILAAALFGSAAAAATAHPGLRQVVRRALQGEATPKQPSTNVTTEIDQQVTRREGAATITPSKDKEPEPAASDREVEEERAAAQKPTPTAAARPPRAKKPSAAPVPSTAPELFATANAHRRTGEYSAARVAYETLQAKFPGSSEALVSRVSLGRMLAGAAPALALAHFNAYLSQSQHTTLAAEALYGKARALSDLGNTTAEQQAWKQLLMRFPSSVYADQARAKLEQQE